MRLIQSVAMERFLAKGFNAVTVEDIAKVAGVGPATIYRYFGTKERIVLWEEHDDVIEADLIARLAVVSPLSAIRAAFTQTLAPVLDPDHLSRIQFAYRTPQLHAAALEDDLKARQSLSQIIRSGPTPVDDLATDVLAATALTVLDVAIDSWQRRDGHEPLASLIHDAFDSLTSVATSS